MRQEKDGMIRLNINLKMNEHEGIQHIDEATRQRMNRDSALKNKLKDMTNYQLQKFISIKVKEELARIKVKRILNKKK
jgi:hypothetical protein